jgi:hypothetical protein
MLGAAASYQTTFGSVFNPMVILEKIRTLCGLHLARYSHHARFHFVGIVPFGGFGMGIGVGLGINNGLRVLSDAHLHHAGVLCMPQL